MYLSTAEVFGPAPQGVTHKEYDRYNSGNPYAAAKVRNYSSVTNVQPFPPGCRRGVCRGV